MDGWMNGEGGKTQILQTELICVTILLFLPLHDSHSVFTHGNSACYACNTSALHCTAHKSFVAACSSLSKTLPKANETEYDKHKTDSFLRELL